MMARFSAALLRRLAADPAIPTMTAAAHTVLSALDLHEPATVLAVAAPAHAPEWADWLAQIGFLPGEMVTLTARARPGGDPLVVRVGDSTFALRRAEAECVTVHRPVRAAGGAA